MASEKPKPEPTAKAIRDSVEANTQWGTSETKPSAGTKSNKAAPRPLPAPTKPGDWGSGPVRNDIFQTHPGNVSSADIMKGAAAGLKPGGPTIA